jgi:hypothetical protein
MKRSWMSSIAIGCACFCPSLFSQAQQVAPNGAYAKQILSSAIVQMGGAAPASIDASGAVDIETGSRKEHGTIQLYYRGSHETSEQIKSQFTNTSLVFSNGAAFDRGEGEEHSLQLAASEQSAVIPLPLIAALNSDPETLATVAGHESVGGVDTIHVQISKSFASQPKFRELQRFSKKDIWIDPTTNLVRQISFDRREGSGAVPAVRIDFYYSDFRPVQGFLIPFHIEKSVNGTHWAAITLTAVLINGAVPDDAFAMPSP